MPKHELENDITNKTVEFSAALQQKRDSLATALKELPDGLHARQQANLLAQQDEIRTSSLPEIAAEISSIFAQQRSNLASNQSLQLDLINQLIAGSSRIESNGTDGPRPVLQFLEGAVELLSSLDKNNTERRSTEMAALRDILSIDDTFVRKEHLDSLLKNTLQAAELGDRDTDVVRAVFERREALLRNNLDEKRQAHLTAAVGEVTKNEKILGLLDGAAVQNLADETLTPGRRTLENVDRDAAVQRVKGRLAELLAIVEVRADIDRENLTRPGRQLFLIDGDRIRDEQGRKLSDGLIVWRDSVSHVSGNGTV